MPSQHRSSSGKNTTSFYLFSPVMMMEKKEERKKIEKRHSHKKAPSRSIQHAWDSGPILSPGPHRGKF